MSKQTELLKYVAENYTKDQQREMRDYCKKNLSKNVCIECRHNSTWR